jgi:acyl dehydratase
MTNARIISNTPVDSVFSGAPRVITWERLWAFSGGAFAASGWPRKNIHTDTEAARAAGVQRVAASGTQYQGYVVSLLLDLLGEEWLASGAHEFRLPAVVTVGDVITPKARLLAIERLDGVDVVELETWAENQRGERVLAGRAKGAISR